MESLEDRMSLESQARELGIPMRIVIDDETRQDGCDAHAATLVSLDGKHATYQGVCNMGHHYKMKRLVTELQDEYMKSFEVDVHGEISMGYGESEDASSLREY
jgi:hypothetical protein